MPSWYANMRAARYLGMPVDWLMEQPLYVRQHALYAKAAEEYAENMKWEARLKYLAALLTGQRV